MNYYITVSDKNFTKVAEKLFDSLKENSQHKILYFTVNFNYKNKYSNVIPIYCKSDFKENSIFKDEKGILNYDIKTGANMMFIKSVICNKALKMSDHIFCYIDSDCIALKNCDEIFENANRITTYPLLAENCHQYMIYNGKGDPFLKDGTIDLNLSLEADLLRKLNISINKRTSLYRQANVILFDKNCTNIMNEWQETCYKDYILSDTEKYTPFNDETVINCLLWKYAFNDHLGQVAINIPCVDDTKNFVNAKDLDSFINAFKNPKDTDVYCGTFCKIPSKDKINNIKFLHGKVSNEQFEHINNNLTHQNIMQQNKNSKYVYLIHSTSLGDTIASTPVLRKLYNSYGYKIDIVTYHSEIFKNNPYVNNVFEFSSFDLTRTSYKQKFESFFGVGGIKNNLGVEKKHNTIDIRQFHAIDLGFMLHENEMCYDYVPEEYIHIDNLPTKYVSIHVSNTWPSRTYSDEKFQRLIDMLNNNNIAVVLIGKNSIEHGFYIVDKQTKKLIVKNGLDLTNKLNLSQCWHVINKSVCFITMDSGLLHLAGTTDTNIIQLGSSINNKLRAPYRNGSQDYKYKYISGSCGIFCASDIKYGVKEWGTIQGVPPLINCLENKNTFECHPGPEEVFNHINSNFKISFEDGIELFNFDKQNCTIHYFSKIGDINNCKIKIFDEHTRTSLYSGRIDIKQGINYYTSVGDQSQFIVKDIRVLFLKNDITIFDKKYSVYGHEREYSVNHLCFDYDLSFHNLCEIYILKEYEHKNVKVEKNDIVVDIGSNLSTFIHYALENKVSKVYACEPTSYCLNIINKYFKNNDKVIINDVAISDLNGHTFIDILEEGSGANKMTTVDANNKRGYENCNKERVKTQTFKTFIEKNSIQKIDFLKIDCEGGEVFIFVDENKDFFKNKVHKIAMEYHNKQKDDIITYLKSLNYEVYEKNNSNVDFIIGMIYAINKNIDKKSTTLFLAPHLSTGGSPAYLKWLIEENIKNDIKPVVIEYCNYGSYEVQKKQIIDLVGKDNFHTFGNHWDSDLEYKIKSSELIKLIDSINPSVIHLNEISEVFSLKNITEPLFDYLYSKDRSFKIVETSHTSEFNFANKKYLPDRFDFCTPYHLKKTNHLNVEKNIVEMTIPNKLRPIRSETLKKLGLAEDYFHVLNVGLFTKDKNQKYLFDLAEKLQDKKIMFHFVGNTCYYNDCGITAVQKNLKNNILWEERDDVNTFMSCMDLFAFPSLKELNPISIKEALSWNMPCYINHLEIYDTKYDNHPLINYIENDNLFNLLNNIPYV